MSNSLLYAIYNNDIKLVKKLIKAGADINFNINSKPNYTPICLAIKYNYINIVKELIIAGVDLKHSTAPLSLAIDKYHVYIATELIKAGAAINVNYINNKCSILFNAIEKGVKRGEFKIINVLFNSNVIIDLQSLYTFPEIIIPEIHKRFQTEDTWTSVLTFLLKGRETYSQEDLKYCCQQLLSNQNNIPDNAKLILLAL